MTATVVIFTKVPVPGRVKTRLIPAIGAEAAARLHRAMVSVTLERALASGLPVRVAVAGDMTDPFVAELRAAGVQVSAQAPGDLGDKLLAALDGPGRHIGLGTDCPTFDPAWLQRAATADTPVTIGPCEDGGYWLIGVDDRYPSLFRDMLWSTDAVLPTTLRRARAAGLEVELLPERYDIDEPADLARLRLDPACPEALRPLLGG